MFANIFSFVILVIFIFYNRHGLSIFVDNMFNGDQTELIMNTTFYNQYRYVVGCESDNLTCFVNFKSPEKITKHDRFKLKLDSFVEVNCIPECEIAAMPDSKIEWWRYCSETGFSAYQYKLFNRTMYEEELGFRSIFDNKIFADDEERPEI